MSEFESAQPARGQGWRSVAIATLPEIPVAGSVMRPIRRELDSTAVSINAYTGHVAGDEIIEPHDETSPNAGAEEEVYVVLSGRASFDVGDQALDAPAGTILLVEVGTHRAAKAAEDETTILIVGAKPGAALPVSAFEYWYLAEPHYESGDYPRAIAVASEGLADHPRSPGLNYQLACYYALDGDAAKSIEHLQVAIAERPESAEWAADDEDFDGVRNQPGFPIA